MKIDKSWNVSAIKDAIGNELKENYAPEIMIKFIAHVIRCQSLCLIYSFK